MPHLTRGTAVQSPDCCGLRLIGLAAQGSPGRMVVSVLFRTRDVAGGKLGTNQSDELKERG